jgi:hypothetical protein
MTPRVSSRYSINKRGVEQHAKLNQLQAITQIKIKEISIMSNLFTAVSVEQQEIVAGGKISSGVESKYRSTDYEELTIKGFKFENGKGGSQLWFDKLEAYQNETEYSDIDAYTYVY